MQRSIYSHDAVCAAIWAHPSPSLSEFLENGRKERARCVRPLSRTGSSNLLAVDEVVIVRLVIRPCIK